MAGTLICTADGYKAIEDIEVGDEVYSSDMETGDVARKPVEQVFVNETNELVHLTVDGKEIVTTPTHPFYAPHKGWTAAVDLRAGDILVTVNGEYVVVEQVQHEILEAPVKVYNFEVVDYHTYYVSESSVLVHNQCTPKANSGKGDPYQVSESRREHILEGGGPTDPGHGPNRGFTLEEGAFPDTWTDDQVIAAIERVANSPKSTWKQSTGSGFDTANVTIGGPDVNAPMFTSKGTPVRFTVFGQDHGLNIWVILEPLGEGIITGYNKGH